MNFNCIIKRIGTLIYPRNSDPLKSLSLALHNTQSDSSLDFLPTKERESSHESVLREAGDIINDMLHTEIRRLREESVDLTTFNLKDSIENTNKSPWDFIQSCTQSVQGQTGRVNSDDNYTKTVRRFSILFTTNSSCATILHH